MACIFCRKLMRFIAIMVLVCKHTLSILVQIIAFLVYK